MTKTLSVSVDDKDKADSLVISGSQIENSFNPIITLSIGQARIALDSKELTLALKAVIDFQQTIGLDSKNGVTVTDINSTLPLFAAVPGVMMGSTGG